MKRNSPLAIALALLLPALAAARGGGRVPTLQHLPPLTPYDTQTALKQALSHQPPLPGHRKPLLVYMVPLSSSNPATARTAAKNPNVGALLIDAKAASPQEITGLVNSVRDTGASVLGVFHSPRDFGLKPKRGAGLHGAILANARSLKDVQDFLSQIQMGPVGKMPVGPDVSTGHLSEFASMVAGWNDMFVGGVSIASIAGVNQIEKIVKTKDAGLSLVLVDRPALTASYARKLGQEASSPAVKSAVDEAVARIESATKAAGVALGGDSSSRRAAHKGYRAGYQVAVLGSDMDAINAAARRFGDRKRDLRLEPQRLEERIGKKATDGVRQWIDAGKVVPVGFLMTPDVKAAQRIASKTSALWIDAEHGPFQPKDIGKIIRSLPAEAEAFVRVGRFNHRALITTAIQAGAKGVITPTVETPEQAKQFVSTVRERSPEGSRPMAIVMIETAAGVANAAKIAAVAGVDLVHLGPYDLAKNLSNMVARLASGQTGDGADVEGMRYVAELARRQHIDPAKLSLDEINQLTAIGSQMHTAAIHDVEVAVRDVAKKPLGFAAASRKQLYDLQQRGYRFVTTISDQEAVNGTLSKLFQGQEGGGVRVVASEKGADPLGRYGATGITIVRAPKLAVKRPGATDTSVFRLLVGNGLTVQPVSHGDATPGTEWSHSHPQGQVTIVQKGTSYVKTPEGKLIRVHPGDMVVVAPGQKHTFVDGSRILEVIDVLTGPRTADIAPPKAPVQ